MALAGVATAAVAVASPPAHAGCTRDSECKGARICESGRCVNPPQDNQPQGNAATRPAPVVASTQEPAQAPPEQAAKRLFEAGRYADAAVEFEKAYRSSSDPALLYNMAVCYRLLGDAARAVSFYEDYHCSAR